MTGLSWLVICSNSQNLRLSRSVSLCRHHSQMILVSITKHTCNGKGTPHKNPVMTSKNHLIYCTTCPLLQLLTHPTLDTPLSTQSPNHYVSVTLNVVLLEVQANNSCFLDYYDKNNLSQWWEMCKNDARNCNMKLIKKGWGEGGWLNSRLHVWHKREVIERFGDPYSWLGVPRKPFLVPVIIFVLKLPIKSLSTWQGRKAINWTFHLVSKFILTNTDTLKWILP